MTQTIRQNLYDNPDFFTGYKQLRDTASGLNEVLEQPALKALLPPLAGKTVLELGCGMGQFARWCVEQGAIHVTGIDVSEKMLAVARQENSLPQIDYVHSAIEDLCLPEARFDIAVSALAIHYIKEYDAVLNVVHACLKPGGSLIFSVEHPMCTASQVFTGWIKDEQGEKSCWAVDDYGDEGVRTREWFVDGVVTYHRTVSTYINTLIRAEFAIEQVEEPEAIPEALESRPDLAEQKRRPPFLLIKAAAFKKQK